MHITIMAVKAVGALTAIICYIHVAWQVTGMLPAS